MIPMKRSISFRATTRQIGELSCPTKYFEEASSINFRRSVVYGLGVLKTALQFRLQKWGIGSFSFLQGGTGRPN